MLRNSCLVFTIRAPSRVCPHPTHLNLTRFPFDVLIKRTILACLARYPILGSRTHYRVVLLSLGHFGSSVQVRWKNSPSFLGRLHDPHRSRLGKFLLLVAMACSVRVTSSIMGIPFSSNFTRILRCCACSSVTSDLYELYANRDHEAWNLRTYHRLH